MITKTGESTLAFERRPRIAGWASVVGGKEGSGPLGKLFDKVYYDSRMGLDTYEEAESFLQKESARLAMEKCGLRAAQLDGVFAGDLLNQCVSSVFGLMDYGAPYMGLYGACSTMAETLINAAVFVEGGAASHALCTASSHFCSAERQYRFPMEYGSVRTPTAQWTVTGAGSCILTRDGGDICIDKAVIGRIVDYKMTDANNMGAAMAPAACDTLDRFFTDTHTMPADYDAVFTGDLGYTGSGILYELLAQKGYDIEPLHHDCGLMIFDRDTQDVHAGGSGCGCCASVLCSKLLGDMREGKLRNILFIATGALLSTTTSQQGKSIPSIAHLVNIIKE